jgi:hypothetical protein
MVATAFVVQAGILESIPQIDVGSTYPAYNGYEPAFPVGCLLLAVWRPDAITVHLYPWCFSLSFESRPLVYDPLLVPLHSTANTVK